jgi:hypothetical protein
MGVKREFPPVAVLHKPNQKFQLPIVVFTSLAFTHCSAYTPARFSNWLIEELVKVLL